MIPLVYYVITFGGLVFMAGAVFIRKIATFLSFPLCYHKGGSYK